VDTTNDSACSATWISTTAARQVTLNGLTRNTNYYWEVRARNAAGVTLANSASWWKFTTAR
jgi:hypothetical protein